MAYIYKIENQINNKIYIGATTRYPIQRFKEHCRDAKRFTDRPLYKAMNKYGKENFDICILEECSEDELEQREKYWIEKFRSFKYGYNATYGGSGKAYVDYDVIVSLWNEGKNMSEIAKITSYCMDTIKIALEDITSNKERHKAGIKSLSKAIAMIDVKSNDIIKIFSSIRDAYRFLEKISNGHIESVCKGKRKTAYGYKWKYLYC